MAELRLPEVKSVFLTHARVEFFTVFFQSEQPRDQFEPLALFRFDELREFALRQCDALFEIFKGKPYDLLHQRVHGGNLSVADARAPVAVNEDQLGLLQ